MGTRYVFLVDDPLYDFFSNTLLSSRQADWMVMQVTSLYSQPTRVYDAIAWGRNGNMLVFVVILEAVPRADLLRMLRDECHVSTNTRGRVSATRVVLLCPISIDTFDDIIDMKCCVTFDAVCNVTPSVPVSYDQWRVKDIRMKSTGTNDIYSVFLLFQYEDRDRSTVFDALRATGVISTLFATRSRLVNILEWSAAVMGAIQIRGAKLSTRLYTGSYFNVLMSTFEFDQPSGTCGSVRMNDASIPVTADAAVDGIASAIGPFTQIAVSTGNNVRFFNNTGSVAVQCDTRVTKLIFYPIVRPFAIVDNGDRDIFVEGTWKCNIVRPHTIQVNFDTVAELTCYLPDRNVAVFRCTQTCEVPLPFAESTLVAVTVTRKSPF